MAAAAFAEDSSNRARSGSLSVSKASSKIGKLRRGGAAGANQRPPPTVYKTEPEGFRSLVQELTGPSPSFFASDHRSSSSNIRLQKMAPPPLSAPAALPAASKPSFYTPSFSPKFNFGAAGSFSGGAAGGMYSPKFAFSPLTFSPLAELTPRDSLWASGLESPGTAEIKTLAQLVAGDDAPLTSPSKLDRAGSFTFSPKFYQSSSSFGMSNSSPWSSSLSDFSFSGL